METFNTHHIKQCVYVLCIFSILKLLSLLYLPSGTRVGTPYLHNKLDQWIYPVAGHTHTHTAEQKQSPSVNDMTQMNSQGPWAPLKDKATITVDKGVLKVRETQRLGSFLHWSDLKFEGLSVCYQSCLLDVWFPSTCMVAEVELAETSSSTG